jgi:hypothetical protein
MSKLPVALFSRHPAQHRPKVFRLGVVIVFLEELACCRVAIDGLNCISAIDLEKVGLAIHHKSFPAPFCFGADPPSSIGSNSMQEQHHPHFASGLRANDPPNVLRHLRHRHVR